MLQLLPFAILAVLSRQALAVPVWGQAVVSVGQARCIPGTGGGGGTTTTTTSSPPANTGTATYTDYLAVYFKGEFQNGEQIYMSVSNNNNPASWTAVNNGNLILQSNVGTKGVRDPSLIRSPDGKKFWIIATDLNVYASGSYETENGSKGIVVWESSDLKNWSAPALRIISPSNAGMTWAPDAIWDPSRSQYLVFWTCNLKGQGWYIMKSYTSDFKSFSTAEIFLSGAGMDATIALDKSTNTFYRISKNGPNELIEQARATSLSGTWTVVKNQIGSGTIPKGEGPLIFQNNLDSSKARVEATPPSRPPTLLQVTGAHPQATHFLLNSAMVMLFRLLPRREPASRPVPARLPS
ncbi:hypothetical protein VNI00_014668 [Paramarasmius palmivorus]|uniref:Glycosyl hydrolase family 32 N-terminal domain-containing protein n=1 Tax=Paramarasmius palmivorus TaxID=297713 RepID=A0AAW0BSN2_9AGAR